MSNSEPHKCTVCDVDNPGWHRREEVVDRLARGATVSVAVGPCDDCGYVWRANPNASTAECPQCAEGQPSTADPPTVSVPSSPSLWECRNCGSVRGGRQ